ncbi:UNVERIFIED_CONTAM: hypothetical protein Sradi_7294400 [Sesamum radiatum]|uniref:Reverse transcriptase/retrotransposon-derived protein RNase H-like domain-containing protein n=1 Tax=Sesamum radiatum TaxID=300843 RepID=A0AAW2IIT8_SESRA
MLLDSKPYPRCQGRLQSSNSKLHGQIVLHPKVHTRGLVKAFMPLLRKNQPFTWTPTCEAAFKKLQQQLMHLPMMRTPVAGRPLRLYLAMTEEAIGGLLAQLDDEGIEQHIYYISQILRGPEKTLSEGDPRVTRKPKLPCQLAN